MGVGVDGETLLHVGVLDSAWPYRGNMAEENLNQEAAKDSDVLERAKNLYRRGASKYREALEELSK